MGQLNDDEQGRKETKAQDGTVVYVWVCAPVCVRSQRWIMEVGESRPDRRGYFGLDFAWINHMTVLLAHEVIESIAQGVQRRA